MADARLFDRGFQTYEGERTGTAGAVRSVMRVTAQKAFGIRRSGREKIFPFLVIAITLIPALGFLIFSFTNPPPPEVRSTYASFLRTIGVTILLFTAFVAPETICPDRRSGLLSLYLSGALTRTSYVLAKAASIAGVIMLLVATPLLLILLGLSFAGLGPQNLGEGALEMGRILASSFVIAVFFASIAIGISSFTDRRAFAAVGFILLIFGSGVATNIVSSFGAPSWTQILNFGGVPFEIVFRIFGDRGDLRAVEDLPLALGALAWTALGFGIAWIRYQRMSVTK